MSYSLKIHDPAFDRFVKNNRNYRYQFALGLALAAIIGFYFYGENSPDMNNPEALYIGLGIGAMFLLIGIFGYLSGRPQPDWDGEVIGKEIRNRKGHKVFVIIFEYQNRNIYELIDEDQSRLYDYYNIGEKVRYHGKLKTIEKYDKSRDDIIFCNACSFLNDIQEELCINCNCPLLK